MVATSYKSARNLPTNIMEHTNNPWLCISHPAPAAWASSSAYQGLARRKTNELIPKWCQQIQTDSIRFHSSHLATNPPDLFGKNWAHQNFTASQDNSDFSIDLGKKDCENIQTWSNVYNILSGIGCEMNLLVMELNPIQLPTVIWFTIQAVSLPWLPQVCPFCHIFAIMQTCTAEGAVGKACNVRHTVIPRRFTL